MDEERFDFLKVYQRALEYIRAIENDKRIDEIFERNLTKGLSYGF